MCAPRPRPKMCHPTFSPSRATCFDQISVDRIQMRLWLGGLQDGPNAPKPKWAVGSNQIDRSQKGPGQRRITPEGERTITQSRAHKTQNARPARSGFGLVSFKPKKSESGGDLRSFHRRNRRQPQTANLTRIVRVVAVAGPSRACTRTPDPPIDRSNRHRLLLAFILLRLIIIIITIIR